MDKLKITIVANYYYPDVASIANLYKQLAEYLAETMAVTVICAVPCYLGTVPEEYKNGKIFISYENSVRVIRLGVPNFDKSNKISRIHNLYFFLSRAIKEHKILDKQDVVLAVSQPPVFGGYIGMRLAKLTGAKFIYNIQDFNPEQMEYSGFSRNSLILDGLRMMDIAICHNADCVITVSNDMQKTLYSRMKNKKVPENYVISNWVDTNTVKHVERNRNLLVQKYGLNIDDFLVVYAGNIGVMQNLKTFLLAANDLKEYQKIRFVFIGAGAWLNDMKTMAEELSLSNVIFEPYEPIENIDLVYSLGDLEIVSIGENVTKCSMPSKTWNILSCGVPVVCQVDADSEFNTLINDNEVGYTVAPNEHKLLAQKILELFNSSEKRSVMGANARKLAVREFDRSVSLQRYKEIIYRVTGFDRQ